MGWNFEDYLNFAISLAKEAGQIQMKHYGQSHSIEYKGEINPVTEVDKLCDQFISQRIIEKFPDHDILTEEDCHKIEGASWKWIIDPLDGTTNYFHRFPYFCVSIALEVDGEVKLGVVYNPVLDEVFYAQKGEGAYLNGKRLRVSNTPKLERGFLATGFPYDLREHADFYLKYFREFITKSFAIRRGGSAALDLSYLAAGRFDGFWELKLQPWDVAAGSLLILEAGGEVSDFRGNPFNIYIKEILASNGLIHGEMLDVMKKIL